MHALTDSHGECSSKTSPIGANTRRATSATVSSRSKTSTERHGVMTIGALIAARYSATRDCSTPSGAAAPSATLTSVLVVFGAAIVLVVPALALLFVLAQRNLIEEGERPQPHQSGG